MQTVDEDLPGLYYERLHEGLFAIHPEYHELQDTGPSDMGCYVEQDVDLKFSLRTYRTHWVFEGMAGPSHRRYAVLRYKP